MFWSGRAIALALATLLLISACKDPTLGREPAGAYFRENRTSFERIVEQVELCQPPDGRIDAQDSIQCTSPNGSSRALLESIRQARARWVRAFYSQENDERRLARVQIAIHAYGLSYAGEIEAFIYEKEPADRAEYQREDDGLAVVEREPLTDAPHHWYWWRIQR